MSFNASRTCDMLRDSPVATPERGELVPVVSLVSTGRIVLCYGIGHLKKRGYVRSVLLSITVLNTEKSEFHSQASGDWHVV